MQGRAQGGAPLLSGDQLVDRELGGGGPDLLRRVPQGRADHVAQRVEAAVGCAGQGRADQGRGNQSARGVGRRGAAAAHWTTRSRVLRAEQRQTADRAACWSQGGGSEERSTRRPPSARGEVASRPARPRRKGAGTAFPHPPGCPRCGKWPVVPAGLCIPKCCIRIASCASGSRTWQEPRSAGVHCGRHQGGGGTELHAACFALSTAEAAAAHAARLQEHVHERRQQRQRVMVAAAGSSSNTAPPVRAHVEVVPPACAVPIRVSVFKVVQQQVDVLLGGAHVACRRRGRANGETHRDFGWAACMHLAQLPARRLVSSCRAARASAAAESTPAAKDVDAAPAGGLPGRPQMPAAPE